jgi:hypothetical protein
LSVLRHHRGLRAVLVASAFACLHPRVARAEEPEPIRLSYAAPQVCPDEAAFVAQLRARTQRARLVTGSEQERRTFEVEVTAAKGGYEGKLVIRSAERKSDRTVGGQSCDEVVAAMGLVTALAIDPQASTKAVSELPPAPEPPPPELAAAEPPPPEPPPPPPPEPLVKATPPEPTPAESVVPPARKVPPWRVALGFGGGVRGGTLPSAAPDASAFVALRKDEGLLAPSFRLSFAGTATQQLEVAPGTASFRYLGGRAEGCPVRIGTSELGFRPCAGFEVGSVAASADGVSNAQTTSRPWYAATVAARVEWEVVRKVFVEGSADMIANLREDRFYFGPDMTLYRQPLIGAAASLSLAFVPFP